MLQGKQQSTDVFRGIHADDELWMLLRSSVNRGFLNENSVLIGSTPNWHGRCSVPLPSAGKIQHHHVCICPDCMLDGNYSDFLRLWLSGAADIRGMLYHICIISLCTPERQSPIPFLSARRSINRSPGSGSIVHFRSLSPGKFAFPTASGCLHVTASVKCVRE
jgi:hypothetical protein